MLATLTEVLKLAQEGDFAVGAFNTPNLECLLAVLHNAEKLHVPVIISHAELHEEVAALSEIGPVMLALAERASVPVCVHLDHGENLSYIEKALKLGFTSVMYDGSLLPYEENVANTRKVVAMAKSYGADVEAEIGILGGREAGAAQQAGDNCEADDMGAANGQKVGDNCEAACMAISGEKTRRAEDLYTDPELAKRFVEETDIDALACSFGTAHGLYTEKPKLDLARIEKIYSLVQLPLVMHGGSGVSAEDYEKAIARGIRKINYYSYMSHAGVTAVQELLDKEKVTFYHDIADKARGAMESDVEKAMQVFYKGRGEKQHEDIWH